MTVLDQASPTEAVQSTVQEPASEPIDSEAVVAVVMDFVGATLRQLDHLLERMRLSPCGPGVTGSLFQWSRRTLDGVRVTEVWQSRQYFEITFREDIPTAPVRNWPAGPRNNDLPSPQLSHPGANCRSAGERRGSAVSSEEVAVGRYPPAIEGGSRGR